MNMFCSYPRLLSIITIALCIFTTLACAVSNNAKQIGSETSDTAGNVTKYSIHVSETATLRNVSDHLMGFNLVYAHEHNEIWEDGKIRGYLKDVNTRLLRWPGGTVTSYYHWDELTGEGWLDSWDPNNPVTPKPDSEFMDLDQYIELIRHIGAEPLVGINMSSAWRWNRMEDGINEALALMQYCRDNDFEVTYWYLDNEPYMHDSNGGEKTIEEYAELIREFGSAMRAFDSDIKLVANWRQGFSNQRFNYETLLEIAGEYIDVIDVHWYWSWGDPNMVKWLSHTPKQLWTGYTYTEEIAYFREMTVDFGYPDIKLATLEWNIGLGGDKQYRLTPHQVALIQSEMMMQFVEGGLDMAAFWPIHWPSDNITMRSFVDTSNNQHQPNYHLFRFLGAMQNGTVLALNITEAQPHISSLAVMDEQNEVLRISILNKNNSPVETELVTELTGNWILQDIQTYVVTEDGQNSRLNTPDITGFNQDKLSLIAPEISMTMLELRRN